MRRVTISMLLFMMFFLASCGANTKHVENETDITKTDSNNYIEFLSVGADKHQKLSNEVFSIQGPLVRREIIQNKSGQIIQVIDYEYDEKNRYSRIETKQYDISTNSLEMHFIDDFEYDDYFMYHTTNYLLGKNESYYEVKDAHENTILLKLESESNLQIVTYSYDYFCDTELRYEEYCYKGEGLEFSHFMACSYNQHGDEISRIVQNSDDEYVVYTTEYEYDSENRIIYRAEIRTEEKNYGLSILNKIVASNREYKYNEAGVLESEINTVIYNKDSCDEKSSVLRIYYEYDERNRLIREVHEGEMSIIYEYNEKLLLKDKKYE